MNYFKALIKGAEELTERANEYLKDKPFISNDEVVKRIDKKVREVAVESGILEIKPDGEVWFNEDVSWDELPWWAIEVLDGHIPYAATPNNGSLKFLLGFSPAALDANLRSLLEVAEGRASDLIELPTVAEVDIEDCT